MRKVVQATRGHIETAKADTPVTAALRAAALGVLALGGVVILAAYWPAVAAASSPDVGPLDEQRIRELIVGNTVVGPLDRQLYDFSYADDGTVLGSAGPTTDSGTWRIRDGNVFCHEWATYFGGDERCYQWYDVGEGRYLLKNVDTFRIPNLPVWRIVPGWVD